MKKTKTLLIGSVAAGFLLAGTAQEPDPTQTQVNRLFTRWDHADTPGAALCVVKDGKVVYEHGYGRANLEHGISVTPQTLFDVASVAKQFTGLALAMLIEQDKVSVSDDVHKHLPWVPDFGKSITIAHLLHHTSGLRDWPETLEVSGKDLRDVITMETILEMVRRQRELDFPPGDHYSYSNTGYNLLAAIVGQVGSLPFAAWMQTNIFVPLGMRHTHVCEDPALLISNRANSYSFDQGKHTWKKQISQLAAPGSSSLFTSAEDMGHWLLNFDSGQVGGKAAIEALGQPGVCNDGKPVAYSFGLSLGEYRGTKVLRHSGGWAGYRSGVIWLPEKRLGVAVLANASDLDAPSLAQKIADLYASFPSETAPSETNAPVSTTFKPDPSRWNDYVGTYRLGSDWLLTITCEGDQLLAQATREAKFKMSPLSTKTFFVEAYHERIEFVPDDSGHVHELLYRGIHAPKLQLPPNNPDYLAGFAGDFWSEELRVMYRFEIRDGKLATWHPSQGWVTWLPTRTNSFDSSAGFGIEFTRDANNQVVEMKISGGRVRNLRFERALTPKLSPKRG